MLDERPPRHGAARPELWCGLLAIAVHLAVLGNGFAMDDQYNLVANPEIRNLVNIPGLFRHAWTATAQGGLDHAIGLSYWRPLAALTWTFEYAVWGMHPFGYHAVNLLLHGFVTLLVTQLVGRWTSTRGAWLAGVLFAVHPVHTEVICLVTYRSELLSASVVAVALGMHHARTGPTRWPILWALYAVALLGKESAAVLPALLAAQDWAMRRRLRDLWPLYAGLTVVALGWLLVRHSLVSETPLPYLAALPGSAKIWTSFAIQGLHARLFLWPWPLVPFYDWTLCPPALTPLDPRALLGLLAVVGPAWLAWRLRQVAPVVALGLGWWLIGLLPTSQLVPLPVGAAERFLYLPSLGACLALAGAVQALAQRPLWQTAGRTERRIVVAGAAAIALLLGGLSARRTLDWRDDLTLIRAATVDFPESFNAWHQLGQLHAQAGRWVEAVASFERADLVLPGFEPNLRALALARRRTR